MREVGRDVVAHHQWWQKEGRGRAPPWAHPRPLGDGEQDPLGGDWVYDKNHHQLRSTNSARVLATIRNLAIGILRLAGVRNMIAALRWVGRDAERAAALLGA